MHPNEPRSVPTSDTAATPIRPGGPAPDAGGGTSAGRRRRRLAAGALVAVLGAGIAPADSAEHVVVAGETLSGIADDHGVGLAALAERNTIGDVDRIVVGQVLVLPEGAAGGATTHRVAGGDTLAAIAAAYGVSTGSLVEANGLADPNLIVIGTTLTIPGGATPDDEGGPAGPTIEHRVAPGETLALIAARYGVTVTALADANDIADPNLIVIGAVLAVGADGGSGPAPDPPASDEPQQPAPEAEPPARTHTVAAGETLALIAARYGVTVTALADANGLTDRDLIVTGAVLTVPGVAPDALEPDGETDAPAGPPDGGNVVRRLEFWAAEYDVPTDLFKAITWFESGWNNRLVSEAGAMGIGQLMPTTVEFVSRYLIGEPIDPTVPDDNIRASARYLRYLLDQTDHRPSQAVAAYYQGLTSLRRDGVFESSRFYVDGILALRSTF